MAKSVASSKKSKKSKKKLAAADAKAISMRKSSRRPVLFQRSPETLGCFNRAAV